MIFQRFLNWLDGLSESLLVLLCSLLVESLLAFVVAVVAGTRALKW
jgi:hypothetical protein